MSENFPVTPDPRFRISTATAGQTEFSVPFPFQTINDISVVKEVDGVQSALTLGVHYTIAGQGAPEGGSITLVTPCIGGEKIYRIGDAELSRIASVTRQGKFSSEAIDDDLDRAVILLMEYRRDNARAWKAPLGQTAGVVNVGRPGHAVQFDENGNLVEGLDYSTIDQSIENVLAIIDDDENLTALSYGAAQALTDRQVARARANQKIFRFRNIATMLADTLHGYSGTDKIIVIPGDVFEVVEEDVQFEVAPSDATNSDEQASSGVKLNRLPSFDAVLDLVTSNIGPRGEGRMWRAAEFAYREVSAAEHIETPGGAKLFAQPIYRGEIALTQLGLAPGDAQDCSALIQRVVETNPVVVPFVGTWPGAWRVDNMITLENNQHLRIEANTRLQRYSAHSASEDPVIWQRGSNSTLVGAGKRTSSIVSQNRFPKGIVRVGHEDMEHSHAVVTFCTTRGLELTGTKVGGQTSGEPDICLFVPNAQLGGANANYFHTLNDLLFAAANFGLNLRGWANGNMIYDIHGRQLGNSTWGDGALLWIQGALDNVINGVQFHAAHNQIGVILDDYDNTGVAGGVDHVNQFNSITGMVCEQGGASALGLKAYTGLGNFVQLVSNTGGGSQVHSTWNQSRNRLIDPVRDRTGSPTGSGFIKTFDATGTFTVRVGFNRALTGAANFFALAKLTFHGGQANSTNIRSAEYRVPIFGVSNYAIGTPVKLWGDDLTITQTANGPNFVELTVAGPSATMNSSLTVEAQANAGATVD